jgi:hypothetical protein
MEHRTEAARLRKDIQQEAEQRRVPLRRHDAAALELSPRGLEQLAEGYAGRTGRLARPAAEAEVEVPGHRRGEIQAVLGRRTHEINATAR